MKKFNIVTSCDKGYIPYVIALYNSYVMNSGENHPFYVICHGEQKDFSILENHPSINCIYNLEFDKNPNSGLWKRKIPAMYSRVLIPEFFHKNYEMSLFLDADTIIERKIGSILETDFKGKPCAGAVGSFPWNAFKQTAGRDFKNGWKHPTVDLSKTLRIQAGAILFSNNNFVQQKIKEEFVKFKDDSACDGFLVVESYLNAALAGNFKKLSVKWNTDIKWWDEKNWYNCKYFVPKEEVIIHHYISGGRKTPWKNPDSYIHGKINFGEKWNTYYNRGNLL